MGYPPSRQATLRAFLGLSSTPAGELSPEKNRVAVAAVRRALNSPPISYDRFLATDCWLAGGSVLRWLCGEESEVHAAKREFDFDFFFPSVEALDTTARTMLAQGFQLCGYRAFAQTIRAYLRGGLIAAAGSEICDESGKLAPVTADLVKRLRLSYLELRSPQGDRVQLVAFFEPTPFATICRFDLSICQLVMDAEYLQFGPWTCRDLMSKRLRVVDLRWPVSTFRRVLRYALRGYRPNPTALFKVSYSLLGYLLQRLPPYLLRLCVQPFVQRREP